MDPLYKELPKLLLKLLRHHNLDISSHPKSMAVWCLPERVKHVDVQRVLDGAGRMGTGVMQQGDAHC